MIKIYATLYNHIISLGNQKYIGDFPAMLDSHIPFGDFPAMVDDTGTATSSI